MVEVTVSLPAGVDEQDARRAASQAVAMVALLGEVKDALAESPAQVSPGHLAQAALREERWRQVERAWGLLSAQDVATLMGHKPERARDLTSNLRRRKGLVGVKRRGALMYPGFQFVTARDDNLVIPPAWTQLQARLRAADWSDADLLAWCAAPNSWLEGRSPADEIQDHPDAVSDALAVAVSESIPEGLPVTGAA